MPRHKKPMPAWLVGLILAVAVSLLVIVVIGLLGFGDDPVLRG